MAWFIIRCERKTWTKYVVEAENEDAAIESYEDWQYLGYVDGDCTETAVIGGPFMSEAQALADDASYVG